MNSFERFLEVKEQLAKSVDLIYKLSTVAFPLIGPESEQRFRDLIRLGQGTEHEHYGLGLFSFGDIDYWLCARKNKEQLNSSDEKIGIYDAYIESLVEAQNEKKNVPGIIGGVRVQYGSSIQHLLLTEDLTQLKAREVLFARSGVEYALIGGTKIYHDFSFTDDDLDRVSQRSLKYMIPQKMLCITYQP